MTFDQVAHTIYAIPADYWQLACWSCRPPGHKTLTCTYFKYHNLLFNAYKYFLYQVATNPILKKWYDQKCQVWMGSTPHTGSLPWSNRHRQGGCGGRQSARRTCMGRERSASSRLPHKNQTPGPIADLYNESPALTVEGRLQPQEKSKTVQVITRNQHTCLSFSSSDSGNE